MTTPIYKLIKGTNKLLSYPLSGLLIIFLAVLTRAIQLIFFYNIRVDASFQVMAMQNFVYGHGVSLAYADPNNLAAIHYTPLINWPPGYSLLLAPFYLIFRPHYMLAGIVLDIAGSIMLILYSRAILKSLLIPEHLVNLFTLITSFFVYYFYFIASSDSIAIPFFLGGVYFTIRLFEQPLNWKKYIFWISLHLVLASYIKYLFIPIVFIVPLLLILIKQKGTGKLKKAGVFLLFVLIAFIGSLLLYQKSISGNSTYVSAEGRGFFPAHLTNSYPFTIASIIRPDTLSTLFHWMKENIIYRVFQLIHVVLLIYILAHLFKMLYAKRKNEYSGREFFILLSCLLGMGIFLLLAFLSLRVSREEILPGYFWTYVEEPRYYGLACLLVQLNFCQLIYFRRHFSKILQAIIILFILLFTLEAARGLTFTTNRLRLAGKEQYSWQKEHAFELYADSILKNKIKITGINKAVVAGSWYYMNHRVSIYSHLPILQDAGKLNDYINLHAKEPVLLLVIIDKKDTAAFQPFIHSENQIAGEFDGYYFYTLYVSPN